MSFDTEMTRIVQQDRAGEASRVLEQARALKVRLLTAPATDPTQLGWARYYELKSLYTLGRYAEGLALLDTPEPRPVVIGVVNAAWMSSVGAELALRAGQPERILAFATEALERRLACHDLPSARMAVETANALLGMAGRPEDFQTLLDSLDQRLQQPSGEVTAQELSALIKAIEERPWGHQARHEGKRGLGLALRAAADDGDLSQVNKLLAQGASPDAYDGVHGGLPTPLQAAAFRGHAGVVSSLLRAGASLEITNIQGRSALHHAADQDHDGVVCMLLAAGARIDALDGLGLGALHTAAWQGHSNTVLALLQGGADPLLPSASGATALHIAATEPVVETIRLMLRNGCPADPRDLQGRTPMMCAAAEGLEQVVSVLRAAGADPLARDARGFTVAQYRERAKRQA